MVDDAVIAYVDRWRDPSGDDPEELDELLARFGPLLLGVRDLLVGMVRAGCERDPAIGAQLWTVCEEHGAQVTAIDRAQVSPSNGAARDGADAFSPTHVITGFVDGTVCAIREEGVDVVAYLDRCRASCSDPEELGELLARLGQLLLGERDLLVDAIRTAYERYPSMGAHLWAVCEEHREDVAEWDRENDDEDSDDDEEGEVDEEGDDEDDEESEDDEGLANVIDLAEYRRARNRPCR